MLGRLNGAGAKLIPIPFFIVGLGEMHPKSIVKKGAAR